MTIKAILRNGVIEPLDPLPADWTDGQELVVEDPEVLPTEPQLHDWARELDVAAADLPGEEHDRFLRALVDIEQESKDAVRREWGLP